jgi:hypothetical protein
VYVRFVPATTGSGASVIVTCRSASEATVVVALALSFAGLLSAVDVVAVAVSESTVPAATLAPICTVSVNAALVVPRLAFVHVTVPPAPTAGVVHVQPPGEASDTNVVPAGSVSASVTVAALLGPALATVIV